MSAGKDPNIGRQLDRYQLDKLLGRGATGSVYVATDTHLQREVALKLLHPHLSDQPRVRERFEREAYRVAQLNHSHIIQVYDYTRSDADLYFVMELIAGGSLRAEMDQRRTARQSFALLECAYLMRQVARALQYAHQQDLIHRDIKPGNVLLRATGDETAPSPYDAVLADFGIATLAHDHMLTVDEVPSGTLPYMSPEQVLVDQRVERQTDFYSLGVMFYELVTGQRPYQFQNLVEAQRIHRDAAIPRASDLRSEAPALVDHIVTTCLQKQPADRYANAGGLIRDLDKLIAQLQPAPEREPEPITLPDVDPQLRTLPDDTMLPLDFGRVFYRLGDGSEGEAILRNATTVIGRSIQADLTLNDPGLSRRHAQLTREDDGSYTLTDLDSRNGVYLPDDTTRQTAPLTLQHGAEVWLGQSVRLILGTQAEADTRDMPAVRIEAPAPEPEIDDTPTPLLPRLQAERLSALASDWQPFDLLLGALYVVALGGALAILSVNEFGPPLTQLGAFVGGWVLLHLYFGLIALIARRESAPLAARFGLIMIVAHVVTIAVSWAYIILQENLSNALLYNLSSDNDQLRPLLAGMFPLLAVAGFVLWRRTTLVASGAPRRLVSALLLVFYAAFTLMLMSGELSGLAQLIAPYLLLLALTPLAAWTRVRLSVRLLGALLLFLALHGLMVGSGWGVIASYGAMLVYVTVLLVHRVFFHGSAAPQAEHADLG